MQEELAVWLEKRPELVEWLSKHKELAEWMNQNNEFVKWAEHYKDKRVVIKYGAVIEHGLTAGEIAEEIILLKLCGIHPNIVHGGSTYINAALKEAFPEPPYKPRYTSLGDRITDGTKKSEVDGNYKGKTEVEIVHMVLSAISNEIVDLLKEYSPEGIEVKALGTSPEEPLFRCTQKSEEAQYVGKIEYLEEKLLPALYDENIIPVIPPLGYGVGKDSLMERLNINGDVAASYLASFYYDDELYIPQASDLLFITDVPGVHNINGELISSLTTDGAKERMENGIINKGMYAKVGASIDASEEGVKKAHIISGRSHYSLSTELFTNRGTGTVIVKER